MTRKLGHEPKATQRRAAEPSTGPVARVDTVASQDEISLRQEAAAEHSQATALISE